MVSLVLFPVTIHLANHQLLHDQFEGILEESLMRDPQEMIHLDRLSRKYRKNNLSILSISIDTQRSLSEVKRYVRSKKYDFEVFVDPNQQIFKKLNGNIMPTNVLIDKSGKVVWMHYGYMPGDEEIMEKQISMLLNK